MNIVGIRMHRVGGIVQEERILLVSNVTTNPCSTPGTIVDQQHHQE